MNTLEHRIRDLAGPSELTATDRDRLWISTTELSRSTAADRRNTGRARTHFRHALVVASVVLATGSVAFGASETVRSAVRGTAIDAIDVFRGQEHTQPLSPEAEEIVDQLATPSTSIGTLQPGEGRALATATRGNISATVSAVPTDADNLCLTMVVQVDGEAPPDGRAMACIGPLDANRPIGNIGSNNSAAYRTLGGIALDDVTKIELFFDGHWEEVEMTGNAFAWVAPSPAAKVGALRATMADGRTVIVTTI